MKRFLGAALGILFLVAAPAVHAQSTQDFTVKSFNADYYLSRNDQKTSILDVTERITAEFPNFDQNHGILRAIPASYQDHTLSLSIDSVKKTDGSSWNYSASKQNDNLVLKIGDADTFVHGEQTYVITYHMHNVVNFFEEHDEFFWDVNGDQWPQAFENVTATVHITPDVAAGLQERQVCYGGIYGSKDQEACQISRASSGNGTVVNVSSTRPLNPYETLSFALAFNKGTFQPGPEIAHEKRVRNAEIAAAVTAVTVPPLVAFVFMFRRWRQFGNDPKGRGVIIPEYEPPKGLNSLSSDYLLQQKLRNLAFSAAIIELAVSRYLTISEIKQKKKLRRDTTDYELELIKSPENLAPELKKIVELVFVESAVSAKRKLSELKSTSTAKELYKGMKELESSLASGLTNKGYFIKNPKKIRNGYLGWAGGLAVVGTIIVFTQWTVFIASGLLLAAGVIFLFSFIMPARTEEGVAAHDALLGLKDYIKLAEAERLRFGQSPEGAEKIAEGSFDPNDPKMKIKLFETLLPYAILFGLEKNWAKQFESIYKQPPDWYNGNWTAFNTGYLVGSLSSFQSVSSQTFSSPSSSSGSGFGGGAGGGGGGGGGGGW